MRYVCTAILLMATAASGQNVTCRLSGTVMDPSKAVIPSAEVKLTAELTGFVRTTQTNREGFFVFPDLAPSTFTISISAAGFKTYTQTGIQIGSGEQRSLGTVRMEIGATGETLVVKAEPEAIMTASGERAGILTDTDLTSLAVRGRDFMDAVGLLPGVIDLNESREASGIFSTSSVYILGNRQNQNNVAIDGITSMDNGAPQNVKTMPSMGAVAEVKVLMSNYSAEYGRNSGGTINLITKGGGRQFHVAAGWYHRHEKFNANNYFNNRNGVARTPYRFNIFDYSVSGPIYIPGKLNRDRSKLFFFFSQEHQRQLINVSSRTVLVPTALERQGDFSQSYDVNGRRRTTYDPQANQTPFPGGVVPASRISKIGQALLNQFPLPNFVDPAESRRYQWNYISALSYDNPRRNSMVRIDYSPRQNIQIFGRYITYWDDSAPWYGSWVNGSVNYPLTSVVYRLPGRGYSFRSTVTLTPSLFNEATFGMSENRTQYFPTNMNAVTRKGTGINVASWYPTSNFADLVPNFSFGISNSATLYLDRRISSYLNYVNFNPTYSFADNLSKIYGSHTFKCGVYVERASVAPFAETEVRGSVVFNVDRTNPLDTNYAYTNALVGNYLSYSQSNLQPVVKLRFMNVDWYTQDDWRVRPGLFLNFGIRFSNTPPMVDDLQQQATFVPGLYAASNAPTLLRPALDSSKTKVAVDPRTGTTYAGVLVGTFAPGSGDPANGMAVVGKNGYGRSLFTLPALNITPRLGFSWDPTGRGKTVIRGGGGVFVNRPGMNIMNRMAANPPTVYTPSIYFGTLETLGQSGGQGILAPTSSMYAMYGSQKPETTYNYSFGIQQVIAPKLTVDVSYVGSLARHLWYVKNINAVPAGAQFLDLHPENRDPSTTNSALAANFLRPYQGWGDILMYDFSATSNYNSLQVSATRRLGSGLIAVNYTFSKVLGIASADTDAVSPFFSTRSRNYGVLAYDRPSVLTLRYNYRLPNLGKRLQQRLLGVITDRWEISGVSRFVSGAPFTPGLSTIDSANFTGTPSEGARPDVSRPDAEPVARFGRPVRGSFGNVGRNVLRGPGVNNWDVSVYRRIPIHEGDKYLQLRFEFYNAFNHTQFSAVSQTAKFDTAGNQVDPLFLEPTAARAARRIQLAIRLNW